jgi:hypothetical protein
MRTLFVCAGISVLLPWLAVGERETRVYAIVLSTSGERVDGTLRVTNLDSPQEPIRTYATNSEFFARPARYLLRVEARGFAVREQILEVVVGGEIFCRIGLSPARLSDVAPNHMRGTVVDRESRPVQGWIKLVPILNNDRSMEMPIGRDGSFEFSDLASGYYVALIVSTDRLLRAERVYCCTQPASKMTIRVGP